MQTVKTNVKPIIVPSHMKIISGLLKSYILFSFEMSNDLKLFDNFYVEKFLDAGIQDVSTSISIVHDLIEMSDDDDGDESDKHI